MKKKIIFGIFLVFLGLSLGGCEKEKKFLTEEEIYYFQAQEYKETNITTAINNVLYDNNELTMDEDKYVINDGKLVINDGKGIAIKHDTIVSFVGHNDKLSNNFGIYALTKKGRVYFLKGEEFVKTKLKNVERIILLDTEMSQPGKEGKEKVFLVYAESRGKLYNIEYYK